MMAMLRKFMKLGRFSELQLKGNMNSICGGSSRGFVGPIWVLLTVISHLFVGDIRWFCLLQAFMLFEITVARKLLKAMLKFSPPPESTWRDECGFFNAGFFRCSLIWFVQVHGMWLPSAFSKTDWYWLTKCDRARRFLLLRCFNIQHLIVSRFAKEYTDVQTFWSLDLLSLFLGKFVHRAFQAYYTRVQSDLYSFLCLSLSSFTFNADRSSTW
jgi:hypothetical protein